MTDFRETWPVGHVGYCAILGRPNAGKSTFLNGILDYHLAAVSSKPQTTRRRWLGILSDDESQILFLDTPGIHRPKHALGEFMQQAIQRAIGDADLLLCMVDPTRTQGDEEEMVAAAAKGGKPVLIAINKTDIATQEEIRAARAFYAERLPDAPIFEIAAVSKSSLAGLRSAMRDALPLGPFLFPADTMTDAFERQIAAEIIRETALNALREEVPHSIAVTIDNWQETPKGYRIEAVLHVERDSQKHIVIGQGGSVVKRIRSLAQRELSEQWDARVNLRLFVKVSQDWRRKQSVLRDLA